MTGEVFDERPPSPSQVGCRSRFADFLFLAAQSSGVLLRSSSPAVQTTETPQTTTTLAGPQWTTLGHSGPQWVTTQLLTRVFLTENTFYFLLRAQCWDCRSYYGTNCSGQSLRPARRNKEIHHHLAALLRFTFQPKPQ